MKFGPKDNDSASPAGPAHPRRPNTRDEAVEVATVIRRLAVLVLAGLPINRAWQHLPESNEYCRRTTQVITRCAAAASDAADVPSALREASDQLFHIPGRWPRMRGQRPKTGARLVPAYDSWNGLAAVLDVAQLTGAPIGESLERLAHSYDDNAETRRTVDVSLSGSRSTARLMTVLPLLSIAFSTALGFDPVRVLTQTPPGILCGALGLLFNVAAAAWSSRMVRSAIAVRPTPGLVLDLVALAVSGGGALSQANRTVADAVERFALVEGEELARAQHTLDLARRAGVPAAELVRSDAQLIRAEQRAEGGRRAGRLAVTLMLPLGCCTLPAFMLLGVAPLMMSILSLVVFPN